MNEKEKRRRKRKEKKRSSGRAAGLPLPPEMLSPEIPPAFAMERTMRSIIGGLGKGGDDAQELAYEAMETRDPRRSVQLALRALDLNPRCVDAALIVARAGARTREELIEQVRAIVRAGEQDLGPRFFKKARGEFWGILETRPYMRARQFLAELLADSGQVEEAVEHLEAMLDLNPNDNQGLRYVLLGHYLALDRLDDAERLLRFFEDECSAMFAWGRVLHRYLRGDEAGAGAALAEARQSNAFAEAYLTGRKRVPPELPPYYGFGDEAEGVVCAQEIGQAWAKHPAAVTWLRAMP